MAVERTLVIIKPDAVQRGLVGEITARFERRGLKIAAMRLETVSRETAEKHYGEHKGKPFYEGLVEYITASPIIAVVFEGTDAVRAARQAMGVTKPVEAAPGSIRGDFAVETGRNLVHGSDSPESAAREIELFFGGAELESWRRDTDRWIFE